MDFYLKALNPLRGGASLIPIITHRKSEHLHAYYLCVFITEIEGQLQVGEEVVSKLRVLVQHLQDVVPLNGVQVAVTQCSHVCTRLPWLGEQMYHFTEDVVFTWIVI